MGPVLVAVCAIVLTVMAVLGAVQLKQRAKPEVDSLPGPPGLQGNPGRLMVASEVLIYLLGLVAAIVGLAEWAGYALYGGFPGKDLVAALVGGGSFVLLGAIALTAAGRATLIRVAGDPGGALTGLRLVLFIAIPQFVVGTLGTAFWMAIGLNIRESSDLNQALFQVTGYGVPAILLCLFLAFIVVLTARRPSTTPVTT